MSVLIGGSPSTGSSLLRRMLNRHSNIFCGSETNLFCKLALYNDFESYKVKIFRKSLLGLANTSWNPLIGYTLEEDYSWDDSDFKAMVRAASSAEEMMEQFFKKPLTNENKRLWIEKTPSNAFILNQFLKVNGAFKVIHITRHPLDIISSLLRRKIAPYEAVALALLNTCSALNVDDSERSLIIKYESLVKDPTATLDKICSFLGLKYETQLLIPNEEATGAVHMRGWNYKENEAIGTGSISSFLKLSPNKQIEIFTRILLTSTNISKSFNSIPKIALALDYNLPDLPISKDIAQLMQKEAATIKRKRIIGNYYFGSKNYPLLHI